MDWASTDFANGAGGPYVMGMSFSIGDIPVGLLVNRWFAIDFDKPEL
jgi:glutathione S-transferase